MSYYNPQQYISIPHFDSPMKSDNFRTFSAMQEAWNRYQQEKRLEELHPLQVENYGLRNRNLTLDNELQEKLNPLKVKSEELLNVLRDKQNTKTQQEIDFDAENNPLLLENNRLKNIGQGIENQYGNLRNTHQRIQNDQAQWGFNNLQNEYEAIKRAFGGKSAAELQAELLARKAQAEIETENANRDWYNSERDKNAMAQRAGDSQANTGNLYTRNTLDVNNKPAEEASVNDDNKYLKEYNEILNASNIDKVDPTKLDATIKNYISRVMDDPDGVEATNLMSRKDDVLTPAQRMAKQQILKEYSLGTSYAVIKDPFTGTPIIINPNADPNTSEGKRLAALKSSVNPLEYEAAIAPINLTDAPYMLNSKLKDNGIVKVFDPETGDYTEKNIPNRGTGYSASVRKLDQVTTALSRSDALSIAGKTANLLSDLKEADGEHYKKLVSTFNDSEHGNLSKKVFTNVSLVLGTGQNGLNLKSAPAITKLLYEICNNPEEFQSEKALKAGLGKVFGSNDQAVIEQLEDVIQNTVKTYKGPKGNTVLSYADSVSLTDKAGKPLGVVMPKYNSADVQAEFQDMRNNIYNNNVDRYSKRKNIAKAMSLDIDEDFKRYD
nr:MAG TPA: hypothetical protein [Caudoviricetes sp.]